MFLTVKRLIFVYDGICSRYMSTTALTFYRFNNTFSAIVIDFSAQGACEVSYEQYDDTNKKYEDE